MSNETLSDISVIICAYAAERWDALVAAVESVQRQTLAPNEIVVVIDHNPALFERVRAQLPTVLAVESSEAQGLSGARNSGIRAARGNLLAFLDDDAIAEPDWLEQLSRQCMQAQVLGVGGAAEPEWAEGRPSWLPEEFYWVIGCTYRGLPETCSKVRNVIGCSACIRREVFEYTGGFRTELGRKGVVPLGCEETELCIRAQQYWPQRVFLYEPRAKVHHYVPSRRTSWRYFLSRCYAEGCSKAAIARFVGTHDALSSEYFYLFHTLRQGIVDGLLDGLIYGKPVGFLRTAAIVVGLAMTTTGYLTGSISAWADRFSQRVMGERSFEKNTYSDVS